MNPALLLAVVPLRFVRLSVGLPCEWFDNAAVVRKAGTAIDRPLVLSVASTSVPAVVVLVNPFPAALPAFRESPELFTVHAKGPAVSAVFSPICCAETVMVLPLVLRVRPPATANCDAAGALKASVFPVTDRVTLVPEKTRFVPLWVLTPAVSPEMVSN